MAFEKERFVSLMPFYEQPARVKRLSAAEKKALDNEIARINNFKMKGEELTSSDIHPGDSDTIAAKYYYLEGPFDRSAIETQDWEVIAMIAEAGEDLNSPLVLESRKKKKKESGSEQPSGGGHATVQ